MSNNTRDHTNTKASTRVNVMLVSQPGVLQNILINSLHGLPISVIGVASGGLSAAEMLKGRQPELMILDASLPLEEALTLLAHLQARYPRVQCLALSETSRERSRLLAGGAHFAVVNFDLPRELPVVIDQLQAQPGAALGDAE